MQQPVYTRSYRRAGDSKLVGVVLRNGEVVFSSAFPTDSLKEAIQQTNELNSLLRMSDRNSL